MQNGDASPDVRKRVRLFALLYFLSVLIGLVSIARSPDRGRAAAGKTGTIAVIPVYGAISVADGGWMGSSACDRLLRRLKALSERADVKAVVLRVNTPGGSVGAVQEIHEELLRLKAAGKKIVVSMGDVAASGGYYIACPADSIFADPGTLTGSIGVILQLGDARELFKKIGLKMEAVKSAEHKDIGSPFRAMTEKERKILQSLIDDAYGQFVDAVARGRDLPRERVLALADGRIYTGAQAKASGLVDELGNLESALAKAKEIAGIEGKPKILHEEDSINRVLSLLSGALRGGPWESALSRTGVRFAYLWEHAL